MESNLKIYSLGIVVETKPEGTDFIMVSPIEVLNIQKPGDMKSASTKFEGKTKSTTNNGFQTEIKSTNYLKAKWISLGQSNRLTPPDVVANETVIILKYENVDEYYWTTIYREVSLRRQENVLYGFSNLKSGISEFDKSTSYWLQVDTKHKKVQFHTAMNDGELTEYDIVIDTKAGTLEVKDKHSNSILIDSKQDTITVNSVKDINMKAKKTINIEAPNINLKGALSQEGNITMKGNMNTSGSINASGSIIDSGGNTPNHSHA